MRFSEALELFPDPLVGALDLEVEGIAVPGDPFNRFTLGIDEDPVTGSVHGPLAVYLVRHGLVPVDDGMAGLTCVQGRPGGRAGLVHALVQQALDSTYSVRIGGQAVVTMRGMLLG